MAIDKHKKTFIINVLRRGCYKWPGRWLAEKRSHLASEKKYYCEQCGTVCRKKDTQMDHINPVIPVEGFTTWDDVLDRMYPGPDGWQRLCKPCHKEKTKVENQQRPSGERSKKGKKKKNE